MSDYYYDPDTDYDKGAREFGERPLITDDRGGSELVPEKDLLNALYDAGGVKFEPEPTAFGDEDDLDAVYMQTLVQYAEIFDEVFGTLGGFHIIDTDKEDTDR
jgi:hypothetical protein